jgi:hypothetical protein
VEDFKNGIEKSKIALLLYSKSMNKQTSKFIINQKVGIWDAKFFCNEAISHDDYFLSTKDLSFTQGISTMSQIISDRSF